MIFKNFKLHAIPTIHDAYCTNAKCNPKPKLHEVSNGLLSVAMFCPNCKSVYILELVRQLNVPKDFLVQCIEEVEIEEVKRVAGKSYRQSLEIEKNAFEHRKLNKKTAKKKK